jgi:hypothetical protein
MNDMEKFKSLINENQIGLGRNANEPMMKLVDIEAIAKITKE